MRERVLTGSLRSRAKRCHSKARHEDPWATLQVAVPLGLPLFCLVAAAVDECFNYGATLQRYLVRPTRRAAVLTTLERCSEVRPVTPIVS